MEENTARHPFEYYAFISYSRKDETHAKWLQKELEHYRLPTVLRKEQQSLPGKIRPIFRDKTDLTTGQLQTALHKELDSSKKLIVLCSPASAKSEWVNKEVQRFIDAGRIEDIIPLIVDGIPNSGGEDECFMPALKLPEEEQILGVSIPELGKKDALLRVIAGLLDIKFDQLKRRHEQRRKRKNIMTAAVACACAVVGSIAGYTAWDYYVPHESYYVDYVLKWGVPVGIAELTKEQTAGMEGHYKITTHKGLVRELVFENSAGIPVERLESEFSDRPMISLFYYRDDGRIEYVEFTEINGRVLATQVYTTDLKAADFQTSGADSSLQTLVGSSTSTKTGMFDLNISELAAQRSDISRYMLEYDENGYVTSVIYYKDRRTPILDADKIGGLEYTNDELGRPVEIRYLNLNGSGYKVTKKGIAGKRYFYDERGNRVKVEYFDSEGALIINEDGWMSLQYEFDEAGNNVKKSYFDADGNLYMSNFRVAYSLIEYDEKGNFTGVEYFDTNGDRAERIEGCASTKKEYDENGRMVRQAFFDKEGEPVVIAWGSALECYEYDERGNYIKGEFFDENYEPILNDRNFASIKIRYDENGNHLREEYFGEDGKPGLNDIGVASFDAEYDERNNLIKIYYYGTDGGLIISDYGFAYRENVFDDRNNNVRADYFGTDGKPILCDIGAASIVYVYDEGGSISEHHYFGVDGKPVLREEGYASLKSEVDDYGNITSVEFFGVNGEPVLCADNYHMMTGGYTERGNPIILSFLGIDGRPVIATGGPAAGAAAVSFEFDERDNAIKSTYLGLDGKPMLRPEGYATITFQYDKHGKETGMQYYGVDGELINGDSGYATFIIEYDDRGDMTDIILLDAQGNLVTDKVFIIGTVEGFDEIEALGLKGEDIFIRYGNWFFSDYEPEDFYGCYFDFLTEIQDTWETNKTVAFYRPSEGIVIEIELAAEQDIGLVDYYINDTTYSQARAACDLLSRGSELKV